MKKLCCLLDKITPSCWSSGAAYSTMVHWVSGRISLKERAVQQNVRKNTRVRKCQNHLIIKSIWRMKGWEDQQVRVNCWEHCPNIADYHRKQALVWLKWPKKLRCESVLRIATAGNRCVNMLTLKLRNTHSAHRISGLGYIYVGSYYQCKNKEHCCKDPVFASQPRDDPGGSTQYSHFIPQKTAASAIFKTLIVLPVAAHQRRKRWRGGGNATDHDNIAHFPPAVWDNSYDLFISSRFGFRQFSLFNQCWDKQQPHFYNSSTLPSWFRLMAWFCTFSLSRCEWRQPVLMCWAVCVLLSVIHNSCHTAMVIVMCIKIDVTSDIRNTEMNPFPVQHEADIVVLCLRWWTTAWLIQEVAKLSGHHSNTRAEWWNRQLLARMSSCFTSTYQICLSLLSCDFLKTLLSASLWLWHSH